MSMSSEAKPSTHFDDQMFFVFKGICSSKYNLFMVNEGDGLVLFNSTSASIETTGAQYQNGNVLLGVSKKERLIQFEVAAQDLSKLQVEQLLKWLEAGQVGELSFHHSPGWAYDVIAEEMDEPIVYKTGNKYIFTTKLKFKTLGSYYAHNLYGKTITMNGTSDNASYRISWKDFDDSAEYIEFSATVPNANDDYIFEYRGQTNTFLYNQQLLQSATNGLTNARVTMSQSMLDHPLMRMDAPFAPFAYSETDDEKALITETLISRSDIEIYKVEIPTQTMWDGTDAATTAMREYTLYTVSLDEQSDTINFGPPRSMRCQYNPDGMPLLATVAPTVWVFLTGNAPSYFSVEYTHQSDISNASYTEEYDKRESEETAQQQPQQSEPQTTSVTDTSVSSTNPWIIAVQKIDVTAPNGMEVTFHHHAFNNIIMR